VPPRWLYEDRVRGTLTLAFTAALAVAASACRAGAEGGTQGLGSEKPVSTAELQALAPALEWYADFARASYADSASAARALLAACNELVAAPSPETFAKAQQSWLAARRPYQQTELLRFYDGPVDRTELLINSWPIDENFVESAGAEGARGIVDDKAKYPELSRELLRTLNGKDGETSISTGYHVVEFLLWGKDDDAKSPGKRAHTDYDAKVSPLAERRGQYLRLATELLIGELDELARAWEKDKPGNYRSQFLALKPLEAFGLVIKGMGTLSGPELAGERLTVAYETKDQENEHSCFSDNTQQDLADNGLGLESVCTGRYQRTDGTQLTGSGVCAAISVRDRALGERLERELKDSHAALRAIPKPFDSAFVGTDEAPGRLALQRAIRALFAQTNTLARIAASYELKLSFPAVKARQ
jgi:putative iron-regulated protein